MVISGKTKVSEIIKADKNSIDALASLAKPLAKLKNPLLRKVMAARVTLDEASKMGGVSLADMARVLKPLGFEFQEDQDEQGFQQGQQPDWFTNLPETQITNFDVRKILDEGGDPLKEIMAHFKTVAEGNALCIIVGFEPVPLINMLQKKGTVKVYTEQVSPQEFHTYFYKLPKGQQAKLAERPVGKAGKIFHDSEADFKQICDRYSESDLVTIDVRALEMPGPRMKIHEELKSLPDNKALYVYHKRIPVYLLEDLADMNFEVHIWNIEEGNVRMLLFKAN